MKTNRLSVLCLAGALLLTGVSFTSCLKGDDVDTNLSFASAKMM